MNKSVATRVMREYPDLGQLKRQSKELLEAFRAGDAAAVAEVSAQYHDADPAKFALHDAQLVLARSYGFESWPKLKAYVEGATVHTFKAAIRAGDVDSVREMLKLRPELAYAKLSGYDDQALHHAVAERRAEVARVLLEFGADPHAGMHIEAPSGNYPSSLDLAKERGYTEIATLLGEKAPPLEEGPEPPGFDVSEFLDAFRRGDEAGTIEFLQRNPELIPMHNPQDGMSALHAASAFLLQQLAEWLLQHGSSPTALSKYNNTPLDIVGCGRGWGKTGTPQQAAAMIELLLAHGAPRTPRWAVATGNAGWLRVQHAQGTLGNPMYGNEGLVSLAVRYVQPEILNLLLDLGFDPDERQRLALEPAQDSWGQPLLNCVREGQIEMAEFLLARGADPNGHIYAAGTPTLAAYGRKDVAWIELMERHGGYLDAGLVGSMGYVERARQMLDDEAAGRLRPEAIPYMSEPRPVAELLIGDGLGTIEILELALPRITRTRDDPWWAWRLRRAWGEGGLATLRTILERCDIAVCAPTELHEIAGNWPRSKKYDAADRLAKATAMLDAGARLDVRDEWFKSTPLGWACRYGRAELVKLYLERGADAVEADAEPWAGPRAWAERMQRTEIVVLLDSKRTA